MTTLTLIPGTPELTLVVGHVYRAKKPRPAGGILFPVYNDRVIIWIGETTVQYDGPAVPEGRHFPRVKKEAFLKWAAKDVTNELPPGRWKSWDK
jgi:hypothetical protein